MIVALSPFAVHIATAPRGRVGGVGWAVWLIAALIVWVISSALIGLAAGKVLAQVTDEG